jgi:hypothetical protein
MWLFLGDRRWGVFALAVATLREKPRSQTAKRHGFAMFELESWDHLPDP